ncbi:DMT family transporter [Desulfovibrio litoralis]|uniref:DMT family transporter n=1 Tax=Desulfovibrio litoralis TaxID=466107 RepID=UPI000932DE03|nr:DMT family transporter [Desulfovibrio litoralis]
MAILFFLGFLSTYLAYFSYCKGMMRLNATKVAVIANLEPVIASLLAWWWWGELFPPLGLLGASLIFFAIFLIILKEPKKLN